MIRAGDLSATILIVQFQTSMGTLSSLTVPAFGGVARTRLTSNVVGTARISAFAPGYGVSQPIEINFTDDPEAIFGGNSYITAVGNSYLAYSATDRVIDAQGKNAGAKVTYRNIEVSADRIQLRCEDNLIRAAGAVTLRRGKVELKAERLYYSLVSGQGYILAERNGHGQIFFLSGENLIEQPTTPIPNTYLLFPELQVKLMIVARGITYFPGDRLQFRRPRFFQDQAQILASAVIMNCRSIQRSYSRISLLALEPTVWAWNCRSTMVCRRARLVSSICGISSS